MSGLSGKAGMPRLVLLQLCHGLVRADCGGCEKYVLRVVSGEIADHASGPSHVAIPTTRKPEAPHSGWQRSTLPFH